MNFNPFGNVNFPFNPFDPNFAQNINSGVQNTLNQTFPWMFSGNSQNQQQQQQNFPQGQQPNVHVNNHYNVNMGNNFYGGPEYDDYAPQYDGYNQGNIPWGNANPNYQQPNPGYQGGNQPKPDAQKQSPLSAKEIEIQKAEQNPNSGHYYKRIGNEYFKKGMYQQAIENYTKTIKMNDTESIFFSNRARSFKNLKQFDKAYEDAKIAIELDDKNIKGFLLCGQILAELGKMEDGFDKLNRAISRMNKALSLCVGQGKKDFEKDVKKNVARVKKVIWLKKQSIDQQKKLETIKYLKEKFSKNQDLSDQKATEQFQFALDSIGDPFAKPIAEAPDYLCCKITMDLMDDPVITQTGITYERDALNLHISKNGAFDPVTREPINPSYIFPNITIKQAIESFLEKHPWAFESHDTDNYLEIKF